MAGYRCRLLLFLTLALFVCSGANCIPWAYPTAAPPRVLSQNPTLSEVIEVINRNDAQIYSGTTTQAKVSVAGYPSLRARLAFERPNRLRLKADMPMGGTQVDIGSNDDTFWFWVKHNQPPGVYFCRHDEFAQSQAQQMIPIDPAWVIEALGVGGFDESLPHEGPFPLDGDRLEILTRLNTPQGTMTKSTIVDANRGWVVETRLRDAQDQLVARAVASRHRQDPYSGLIMPGVVQIECPAAQFSMKLTLSGLRINPPDGLQPTLWQIPTDYPGSPLKNICGSGRQIPASVPDRGASLRPVPRTAQRSSATY